mmetsp:Transcript_37207/g.42832  ORF Transcript_37207/g.42832 Transcript_37207/m.42832 type:complete len:84 (-) Transcript_37207:26-277(-)
MRLLNIDVDTSEAIVCNILYNRHSCRTCVSYLLYDNISQGRCQSFAICQPKAGMTTNRSLSTNDNNEVEDDEVMMGRDGMCCF